MKRCNFFWGIFLLAAAVFIVVSQTVTFVNIGLWSILATVLLVGVLIGALRDRNFFGIFVPLAFLYMIYRGPFGWPDINGWVLFWAAMLASVGCGMIFHPRHHWHAEIESGKYRGGSDNVEGNEVEVSSSFSDSCKYLHSDNLCTASIATSFGQMSVYFDQVRLSPEGATISADASFGCLKLFIPHSWNVVNHLHASFGSVEDDIRRETAPAGAPTLTLTGGVSFGEIEIHYI